MFSTVALHCTILSVIFTYMGGGREGDSLSLSLLTQRDNRQAGQVDPAHSLNYQSTGIFAAHQTHFPPIWFITGLCLPARISTSVGGGRRASLHRLQSSPAEWAKPAFSNVPCTGRPHWSIRNIQPTRSSGTTQASTARASQFILGHWVSKTKWCLMFCWYTAIIAETRRK